MPSTWVIGKFVPHDVESIVAFYEGKWGNDPTPSATVIKGYLIEDQHSKDIRMYPSYERYLEKEKARKLGIRSGKLPFYQVNMKGDWIVYPYKCRPPYPYVEVGKYAHSYGHCKRFGIDNEFTGLWERCTETEGMKWGFAVQLGVIRGQLADVGFIAWYKKIANKDH